MATNVKKISDLQELEAVNDDTWLLFFDLSEGVAFSEQQKRQKAIEFIRQNLFNIRKVFMTDDLVFEQVNDSGNDASVTSQEANNETVYEWDSTMTNNAVTFKLIEDFEVEKSPVLGIIRIHLDGGISVVSGINATELEVNLLFQVDKGDGMGFETIKETEADYYFDANNDNELPISLLNFPLKIDPDNLPFEAGNTLRILLKIGTYSPRTSLLLSKNSAARSIQMISRINSCSITQFNSNI